jgi:hypothetical protein
MNEFLTLEFLGTFAGITAISTLVVQCVKSVIKIDPKWIALITGFVLVTVFRILPNAVSVQSVVLELLNGVLVSGSSIGLFETIKSVKGAVSK